jgi:hypothetical protein
MHWNFAKLQLNALALRGLSPRQAHLMSDRRREFANLAVANAVGTLGFVLEDPSLRASIVGVPLYLHTMITYASVFLLKVQMRWETAHLSINTELALNLIDQAAQLLAQSGASEKHLAHHIARGLSSMTLKAKKLKRPPEPVQTMAMDLSTPKFDGGNQDDWSGVDSGPDEMFGDVYGGFEQEYFPPVFFDLVTSQMPG